MSFPDKVVRCVHVLTSYRDYEVETQAIGVGTRLRDECHRIAAHHFQIETDGCSPTGYVPAAPESHRRG